MREGQSQIILGGSHYIYPILSLTARSIQCLYEFEADRLNVAIHLSAHRVHRCHLCYSRKRPIIYCAEHFVNSTIPYRHVTRTFNWPLTLLSY